MIPSTIMAPARSLYLLLACITCGPSAPMQQTETTTTAESTTEPTNPTTTAPASTTSTPTTSTANTTSTTSTTAVDPSTSSTTDDTFANTFLVPGDLTCLHGAGARCRQCDVIAQDCPHGHKCSPYADDGGTSWNNAKCVPLVRDPDHPGEPCTVEGSGVSGLDSCDGTSMCWDVDGTLMGTCVPFCTGTTDNPICPDGTGCAIQNQGSLALCLPTCDPLLQDCPGDDLCIGQDLSFLCVFDASGEQGQTFDPCMFLNDCDPGLFCVGSNNASECDQEVPNCCLPVCDLSLPPACPGAMQTCIPWFDEGTAPPEYINVGVCALPM